jgi:hypothetical protein
MLIDLGASTWLVRHHRMVEEAMQVLASRGRAEWA